MSFTDDGGTTETVTSDAYRRAESGRSRRPVDTDDTLASVTTPPRTATDSLVNANGTDYASFTVTNEDGKPTGGQGNIADADGLPATFPGDYTFQWVRVNSDGVSNVTNIGSDSITYTPLAADEGKKVKVKVSFTDDGGTTETVTSDAYPASGTITPGTPTNGPDGDRFVGNDRRGHGAPLCGVRVQLRRHRRR